MGLIRKVKKSKKQVMTTEAALSAVTTRLVEDIDTLSAQKEDAVSAFRQTANKLESINAGLRTSVERLDHLAVFIAERKMEAEKMMVDNNAVRGKIIDLIGEE